MPNMFESRPDLLVPKLMIHHIRTSCRRSAGHTDGDHPMLFAATVLGAPAVQQEVRSSGDKKVEGIQVMELLTY
jgi:hypothetical protein